MDKKIVSVSPRLVGKRKSVEIKLLDPIHFSPVLQSKNDTDCPSPARLNLEEYENSELIPVES